MNTREIIILARKHALQMTKGMVSSARLCLEDAVTLQDAGNLEAARDRALKSLRYSVGILHADYKRAIS